MRLAKCTFRLESSFETIELKQWDSCQDRADENLEPSMLDHQIDTIDGSSNSSVSANAPTNHQTKDLNLCKQHKSNPKYFYIFFSFFVICSQQTKMLLF